MATKVFIPELWEGFTIRVVVAAAREAKARGLTGELRELFWWEGAKPGGTTYIFEGPDAKEWVAIFRTKITEHKKAGRPTPKKTKAQIAADERLKKLKEESDKSFEGY